VVNEKDLKARAIANNLDLSSPIAEILSSPIVTIPSEALIYEAVLLFREKQVSHLAVVSDNNDIVGVVSNEDLLGIQQNTVFYLIKEIKKAETANELKSIYSRLPVLVNAILDSGGKTQNITKIITLGKSLLWKD
jgi:CBS domain-containing protein